MAPTASHTSRKAAKAVQVTTTGRQWRLQTAAAEVRAEREKLAAGAKAKEIGKHQILKRTKERK